MLKTKMERLGKSFCKLCLNVISDGNFRVIKEIIRDILNFLLPGLIEQEKNESLICNACFTRLFAAFNFKTNCLDIEDCIFPYVDSERGLPVDLGEIYLKETGEEHLKVILEDERICRLCMQVVASGFTSVNDVDADMLCGYIPEVNFSFTKEPAICEVCLDSLITHTSFLINCLDVEKFKIICVNKIVESPTYIKQEKKYEGNYSHTSCLQNCLESKEEVCNDKTVESLPLIKSEEVEIKSEEYYSTTDFRYGCAATSTTLGQYGSEHTVYKCDSCSYESFQKRYVTQHQLRHKHIPEEQMLKCDSCDFKTGHKYYLKRHQLKHKNIPEEQLYKCDSCDYKTVHKYYLTQHQQKHKDISEGQMLTCDLCDYKTNQKRYLARHRVRHENTPKEQVFKCDLCDYKTHQKRCLLQHQLRHENIPEEQMLKCDLCDYRTGRKTYLKRHQQIHKDIPEEQMLKCNSCGYKTGQKRLLVLHHLRHTNIPKEQTFKCNSCDYKTRRKRLLKRHELRHKDIPEEQMSKCDSCDYKTVYKHNLAQHRLRHKDIPEDEILKIVLL